MSFRVAAARGVDGATLMFSETDDYVGVDVTILRGGTAMTMRLGPLAFDQLIRDRYSSDGVNVHGLKCQENPDDCSPAAVAELRSDLAHNRSLYESCSRTLAAEREKHAKAVEEHNQLVIELQDKITRLMNPGSGLAPRKYSEV